MRMKGFSSLRTFARIGPAFERFAQRAKTTIALLAARRANARRRLRRAATVRLPRHREGGTAHQRAPRRPRRARRSERGRPAEAAPREITRRRAAHRRRRSMIAAIVWRIPVIWRENRPRGRHPVSPIDVRAGHRPPRTRRPSRRPLDTQPQYVAAARASLSTPVRPSADRRRPGLDRPRLGLADVNVQRTERLGRF